MAKFLQLPVELRLQVYRELITPEPRCMRIGPRESGPVLCYSMYGFHAQILRVNKTIRGEAEQVLHKGNPRVLYIYLIFNGDEAYGSAVDEGLGTALEALSRQDTHHRPHIHTCILDIRLFCKYRGRAVPSSSTFEILRTSVKAICGILSRSKVLKQVEISWRDDFRADLSEERGKALDPLRALQVTYKVIVGAEEKTKMDFADWPDMLKPYRSLDFCSPNLHGEGTEELECEVFRPPHRVDGGELGTNPSEQQDDLNPALDLRTLQDSLDTL